jgi:hypothetical protein
MRGTPPPEQWQAAGYRCPCGFAASHAGDFDAHLEATDGMEPEHFETAAGWTLQRVTQWQASGTHPPGPARGARADVTPDWFEAQDRPHRAAIVLPMSAELMVAALYADREHLTHHDLTTDEEVWGHAMLAVAADGLTSIEELADEILVHEHRCTLADPVWLALCRRRVSEVLSAVPQERTAGPHGITRDEQ